MRDPDTPRSYHVTADGAFRATLPLPESLPLLRLYYVRLGFLASHTGERADARLGARLLHPDLAGAVAGDAAWRRVRRVTQIG